MRCLSFNIIMGSIVGVDGMGKEEQARQKDWVLITVRISEVGEGMRAVVVMIGVTQGQY